MKIILWKYRETPEGYQAEDEVFGEISWEGKYIKVDVKDKEVSSKIIDFFSHPVQALKGESTPEAKIDYMVELEPHTKEYIEYQTVKLYELGLCGVIVED